MLKYMIIIAVLSFILDTSIFAQKSDNENCATDNVFLASNKTIYETSEDLWFKAFVFDSFKRKLSDENRTLYLEIRNSSDSVVWKEMYPLSDGMGNGQVYVGDDWTPGEYFLYGYTRTSVGRDRFPLFPQRITVVNELRDFPKIAGKRMPDNLIFINADTLGMEIKPQLHISLKIDSTIFKPRSIIPLAISVTDSVGNPEKAHLLVSVSDVLYHNPGINNDLIEYLSGVDYFKRNEESMRNNDWFLPEGVRGREAIGSKKMERKTKTVGVQWLDVFSDGGSPVFVSTFADGSFEIDPTTLSEMDHYFFVKPVSGKEFKPTLRFESPFDSIALRTNDCKRIVFAQHIKDGANDLSETDYVGRGSIRLPDVEVYGHVRYPKRQKLIGYLDSISSLTGGAWVCGCNSSKGVSYLNDYEPGYTHHPAWNGDYQPKEHTKPIKGKSYMMIKYLPGGDKGRGYVADMKVIEWKGNEYSEEELLRMNNLWKATGYYKSPEFPVPDEFDSMSSLEDIRNTLLWIPNVSTDESGKYETNILTSDICSRFVINVIAVSEDGDVGTFSESIVVSDLSD